LSILGWSSDDVEVRCRTRSRACPCDRVLQPVKASLLSWCLSRYKRRPPLLLASHELSARTDLLSEELVAHKKGVLAVRSEVHVLRAVEHFVQDLVLGIDSTLVVWTLLLLVLLACLPGRLLCRGWAKRDAATPLMESSRFALSCPACHRGCVPPERANTLIRQKVQGLAGRGRASCQGGRISTSVVGVVALLAFAWQLQAGPWPEQRPKLVLDLAE
jgi:hypothetical protein